MGDYIPLFENGRELLMGVRDRLNPPAQWTLTVSIVRWCWRLFLRILCLAVNYPLFFLLVALTSRFGCYLVEWLCKTAYGFASVYRSLFIRIEATPSPPPIRRSEMSLVVFAAFLVAFLMMVLYLLIRSLEKDENSDSAPKVVINLANRDYRQGPFQSERKVAGSDFFSAPMPEFMARVEIKEGGTWLVSGVGFMTSRGFVTAGHVVETDADVRVNNGKGIVEIDRKDIKRFDIDVAVIEMQPLIGMKTAKLSTTALIPGVREMVMVHDGRQASMGPLTESSGFGFCDYGGSTSKGFSGSPYFVNKTVLGMHIGAGAVNFGYESAFMAQHLQAKEDSDEWFLAKVRKGINHKYRQSPYDPDEVMVKIGNRYVTFDRQQYELAREESDRYYNEMADDAAAQMAFGEEPGVSPKRKTSAKAGKRLVKAFQLESAITPLAEYDDHSGNVELPAASVWTSAGQSCKTCRGTGVANVSLQTSLPTISKSPMASRQVGTDPPRPTPAPRKQVSATTSAASPTSKKKNVPVAVRLIREKDEKIVQQLRSLKLKRKELSAALSQNLRPGNSASQRVDGRTTGSNVSSNSV